MAATLKDNWDNIARHRGTVFTPSFVDKLESFCSPIIQALRRLDNKDRYSNEAPDKDDILDVIEAIHKDEATETMFIQAFNACGPVLMMAIHVLAFNCLLHNPEAFADQSVKNASTEALRTNPTKTAVNQYVIDTILQKRKTVQRTDDLWDRSQYSASDTPQRQSVNRGRRLDRDDDHDSTPGTSGTCNTTSRRRLTNLPGFAKPTTPREDSHGRKRAGDQPRQRLAVTPHTDEAEDEEATQLYARGSAHRRSRSMQRRTAARDLPTSFDDESPCQKNKAPLVGPPTAKNKRNRRPQADIDSDSEEEQPPKKAPKTPQPVLSSDSDVDDDVLGITQRTPPQSPFYRGPQTNTTTAATTSSKKKDRKDKPKKVSTDAETPKQKDKANKKKRLTPLDQLAEEQDKMYAHLNKTTRKSK